MPELIIKMIGDEADLMNVKKDITKYSSYIKAISGGRLEIEVSDTINN